MAHVSNSVGTHVLDSHDDLIAEHDRKRTSAARTQGVYGSGSVQAEQGVNTGTRWKAVPAQGAARVHAPPRTAAVIDGYELTAGELARYRKAVLLAGQKRKQVYIMPARVYTRTGRDGVDRETPRYEFIWY